MTEKQKSADWWPEPAEDTTKILAQIVEITKENLNYFDNPMLSFPGTPWHPIVKKVIESIGGYHVNNIGIHTSQKNSEKGFKGSQKLERDVVYWLAEKMGSANPAKEIDGFFVPGGTGGNQQAVWIGRNYLLKNNPQANILVISSELGHNSIAKAANICGLDKHLSNNRHGYLSLPVNSDGSLQTESLKRLILDNKNTKQYTGFIVVSTMGTTLNGACDDLEKISKILQENLKREEYWHHCDAAFGGLVYPFVQKKGYIAWLDSFVTDFHKMGYSPYGTGVFICSHKGCVEKNTSQFVEYINGIHDGTINGSRSGLLPSVCWAVIKSLGDEGFKKIAVDGLNLSREIVKLMLKCKKVAGATEPIINQFAIALKPEYKVPQELADKLCLSTMTRAWPLGSQGEMHQYIKFPVMPHAKIEHYQKIITWLDS